MAHLSPESVFSPSVAKQRLAAAKDWIYIDNWLLTKFNRKPPINFERNNDTLKALLALATFNESIDEENNMMIRVEKNALEQLEATAAQDPNLGLLTCLEENLTQDGTSSINALTEISIMLNRPLPKIEALGRDCIDLQACSDILGQMNERADTLEGYLSNEQENVDNLITDLQSQVYQASTNPAKQVIHYQRKIKEISSELSDSRDRIGFRSFPTTDHSMIKINDLKLDEKKFADLKSVVHQLEIEVDNYHGLPQDIKLARKELDSLKSRLIKLTRIRDNLFESLVEKKF